MLFARLLKSTTGIRPGDSGNGRHFSSDRRIDYCGCRGDLFLGDRQVFAREAALKSAEAARRPRLSRRHRAAPADADLLAVDQMAAFSSAISGASAETIASAGAIRLAGSLSSR